VIPEDLKQKKLAHARSVAAEFTDDPGVLGVYLSGSLQAGLGSSASDVDLFVVGETEPDGAEARQFLSGDLRVDVEFRRPAQIEAMMSALGSYTVSREDQSQHRLDRSLLDDAVRLKIGADLKRHLLLEQARTRIDDTTLRRVLIGTYLDEVRNAQEDAVGVLRDRDFQSAWLSSFQLLMAAFQAFLAGCGELYIGGKWTWQKLSRVAERDELPLRLFRTVLLGEGLGPEESESLVKDRVHLAQALAVAAVTRGWDAPSAASWTAWRLGSTGVHRRLEYSAFRYGQELLLEDSQDFSVRLSVPGMELFGYCDSRDRRAVVADMARRLDPAEDQSPAVEQYLDMLIKLKVVTPE